MQTATYTIPAANLDQLQDRIAKLNKRCRRLGINEIQLTHEHAYNQYEYTRGRSETYRHGENHDGDPTGRIREWLTIHVTGDTPCYDGWSLIGVLEPLQTDDGAENIIQAVPGHEVPAEYRDRVGECDHCHTQRRRNQTFVVRHEDGSHKMVGRQCLRDFLGHADPHALANAAELLCELHTLCNDAEYCDWLDGGARQPNCWSLEEFLNATAAVIRHDGWLSRTKAREWGKTATADWVLTYLNPPSPEHRSRDEQTWLNEITELVNTERQQKQASDAVEWALTIDREENDYLYNLNLIARAGYVTDKTVGLAASMVVAYRRAHDMEIETGRKEARPESNHVGTVKKRQEFTVTCDRIFETEGYYGVTGVHKMTDEDGNDLVWFASGNSRWLDEGEEYRVKATVKEHSEYKGRKQTVVNRLTIVEELGVKVVAT